MNYLNQLVDRLTVAYLPMATQNRSFFVNDIPCDLSVDHNREWVASVIGGLLNTVTAHACDTCIRLSAKKQGHVIVFTIREAGKCNSYAMAGELKQAYMLAEKIGGCLSVSVPVFDETTISFSFPNIPLFVA